MIALIDYRAGNLTSVRKALAACGGDVFVPERPQDLASAHGVIVPGVGHFGATRALQGDWTEAILERVGEGRPLLGICLGMQWLFEGSEEADDVPGLGVLPGRCFRLGQLQVRLKPDGPYAHGPNGDADAQRRDVRLQPDHLVNLQPDHIVKVPHVGWNDLRIERAAAILDGVESGSQVYFTHSYAAPTTGETAATTEHGERFASVVQRANIAGVQFHPEKSGDVGLQVLRNFLQLAG